MAASYPFAQIEPKWQRLWEERRLFRAADDDPRPKFYVLDMFPYPSGAGLHVGHPEGYTATDIIARYKRMRGFNVLHPMGWDAFGLPAEQYAIETGTHPSETTRKNIATFRRQINRFGFSYDWAREVDTTDPAYVRWTQWIFLQLYKQGLAYTAEAPVWWCPECGTVLANEEVVDGTCERKGHAVERKPMRQWLLKITAYADRLLADLEGLDWPEHIKEMQRHWIGRSEGADVWFELVSACPAPIPTGIIRAYPDRLRLRQDGTVEFKIFTTRPDTLFGATYMVLAPEHPLVLPMTDPDHYQRVVKPYLSEVLQKSDLERVELAKEKTGVFTGAYAVNPVNQQKIPIWIADYVLASYGTGAIMAVPAHDQRDWEFALHFGLDIRIVIVPPDRPLELAGMTEAYADAGTMYDSGPFTGLPSDEGGRQIVEWLKAHGAGDVAINYKLRDWLFSRQRYWGEPIPIVHCATCGTVPLPESSLPLMLPEMKDFTPTGTAEPPLAKAKDWIATTCPACNGPAARETNTMPQWAGSCWYYLRYLDAKNNKHAWDAAKEKYWMPVDLYVGGAEHAVLHLLYSRFWHKMLYDLQLVSTKEPFQKLINQGLILGEDGEKMSKSRGNVVNPDAVIDAHGADAFRIYEMFLGPLEAVKPWSTRSIVGIDRFLQRTWRLVVGENGQVHPVIQASEPAGELRRLLHQTIKSVTGDMEGLRFNTAISALMVLLTALEAEATLSRQAVETFLLLVSPLAPHIAEELWQRLGHDDSLAREPWPVFEAMALARQEITWIIQVNGRVRAKLALPAAIEGEKLRVLVLRDARVAKWLEGRSPREVVVVPQKLVNVVL